MTLSESQTQFFDIISMYNCAFLGVSSTSTIFCCCFLSFLSVSPSVENNRPGTQSLLIMKILGTMLLLMIQLPLFFSPLLLSVHFHQKAISFWFSVPFILLFSFPSSWTVISFLFYCKEHNRHTHFIFIARAENETERCTLCHQKVFCVRRFVCFCRRKWIHNVLFHLQTILVIRLNWLSLFHSQGSLFFRRRSCSSSSSSSLLQNIFLSCDAKLRFFARLNDNICCLSSRVMKYLRLFRQISSLLLILTLFSSRLFFYDTQGLFSYFVSKQQTNFSYLKYNYISSLSLSSMTSSLCHFRLNAWVNTLFLSLRSSLNCILSLSVMSCVFYSFLTSPDVCL